MFGNPNAREKRKAKTFVVGYIPVLERGLWGKKIYIFLPCKGSHQLKKKGIL